MRLSLFVALCGLVLMAPVAGFASSAAPAVAASTPVPANEMSAEVREMVARAMTERSLGDPKAPVTLIEYAALTCSHCRDFHLKVLPELKKNYIDTGKVRLVFRDFPFNEIGMAAAMTARCVKPENYFSFVHAIFSSQDNWAYSPTGGQLIKQMAGFAGLAPNMVDACVTNKELGDKLLAIRVEATNSLQVNSTPTFLVEGTLERIVGTQDYAQYAAVLDRVLAKVAPAKEDAPKEATK